APPPAEPPVTATPPATAPPPAATAPAAAPAPPPGAVPAASPGKRVGPPELREQFERAGKALRKADNALGGHDAGRGSRPLQRSDDDILQFETGSGLAEFVTQTGVARQAATANDAATADRAVRRARAASASLADYTVARPAEVAYRSALSAAADRNAGDFL